MDSFFQPKRKGFYRSVKFWLALVGILGVVGIVSAMKGNYEKSEISTSTVLRVDLQQTVQETGSVVPELEISYGFETSGRVAAVIRKLGDTVTEGEVIARLSNASQQARLKEAQSFLSAAQAALNLKLSPAIKTSIEKALALVVQTDAMLSYVKAQEQKIQVTGKQSIAQAEATLAKAKNDLQQAEGGDQSELVNDAYADLVNILKTTEVTLTDVLAIADNILSIENASSNNDIKQWLGTSDLKTFVKAENSYLAAKYSRQQLVTEMIGLTTQSSHSKIDAAALFANLALTTMSGHLLDVQTMLNATTAWASLSARRLETLKANIIGVQKIIATAATSLTNSQQAVQTVRNALAGYQIAYNQALVNLEHVKEQIVADLAIIQSDLKAKEAAKKEAEIVYQSVLEPPREVDLAVLKADILRYQANVAAVSAEFKKTELTALASGVIRTLAVKTGENVTPGTAVVSIISPQLTVEVDVAESDIAKVSLGDVVTMTFDAFDEASIIDGQVASIEPGETEISGVIYYKTKILFVNEVNNNINTSTNDGEMNMIRPGMTVNVTIMTDERKQALVIPARSVLTIDNKSIVRVITNALKKEFTEREVTIGLKGDDGLVEVESGLTEGETIVTFVKEK